MVRPTSRAHETSGWFSPGVAGIGGASLLSDIGHEITTSLLPSLLTAFGAPAAALGLIEGVANGAAGIARFAGGPIADDPERRRVAAVGGYTVTAVLSALIGAAAATWQVGVLRTGAWISRGLRVPARNALLADIVPAEAYGRAYGFERAMDNLGAIVGPLLALVLVGALGTRTTILLSVIPGLLAAVAILLAIRHAPRLKERKYAAIQLNFRPVFREGPLARLFVGISAFEMGNIAATLLILRATQALTPTHGLHAATEIALGMYVAYNVAASLISVPAGHASDRRGSMRVLAVGALFFCVADLGFAIGSLPLLALGFVLAGIAIGCIETAQHTAVATLAPPDVRGSAFGILAAAQSLGNFASSAVAGILWSVVSPFTAFIYLAFWMLFGAGVTVWARAGTR